MTSPPFPSRLGVISIHNLGLTRELELPPCIHIHETHQVLDDLDLILALLRGETSMEGTYKHGGRVVHK
jgi:hypothetical protein